MSMIVPAPLKRFIWDIQSMIELAESEREILFIGRDLMRRLVASDDWLPEAFARPDERQGQPYLLYSDSLERFCVTSTVLREGQSMIVRQDKAWEIFGVLRGAVVRAHRSESGVGTATTDNEKSYAPASVDASLSNTRGSAIQWANVGAQVAIGVHVYGGDIGAISRYAPARAGAIGEPLAHYANPEDAPGFDIWSIQTQIKD